MADSNKRSVVCVEFFSGIGGLHYGLLQSGIDGKVAMSFDMNELANAVYEHNFHMRPNNKAIDYLKAQDIDKHNADCWLLSPPCQPYTRGGNYRDTDDPRARGLLHLIDLLPQLENMPSYLLLENVMNFENSQSRNLLVQTLGELGYEIFECLLSPVQFGIPNSRLRYYLAARRSRPTIGESDIALNDKERTEAYLARGRDVVFTEWPFAHAVNTAPKADIVNTPLQSYIDSANDSVEALKVPESHILKRKRYQFDIVKPTSDKTSTFTKAYGSSHLIGSGPLLQTKNLDIVEDGFGSPEKLLDLGLRFFSPNEVAKLQHFPTDKQAKHVLEFPANITQRQRLQLLGNSLNAYVVAQILEHILFTG
ncbi:hypothetical protein GGH19_003253 [Coemansia sp. RSA 1807]|nr:hypothetical protein GGH19_003253 [Coemansia sp. RSA 1807]